MANVQIVMPAVPNVNQALQDALGPVSLRLPRDANQLYRVQQYYVGLLQRLPPPTIIQARWNSAVLRNLENSLRQATKPLVRLTDEEVITEPVLCLAGRSHVREAFTGLLFGNAEVQLRPMVWIHCGSRTCRRHVRLTLDNLNYLREFLRLLGPESLFLSLNAPYPASGLGRPLLPPTRAAVDAVSCAIQSTLRADTTVCGAKLRYTVHIGLEKATCYSTVGGLIVVNGELLALTMAHGFMSMIRQSSAETESADPETWDTSIADNETGRETLSQLERDFGMNDLESGIGLEQEESSRLEDTPQDNLEDSSMLWSEIRQPEVFAYLGSGTAVGAWNSLSAAPETSDFVLLRDYSPYSKRLNRYRDTVQDQWVEITSHILACDLRAGRVHIVAYGDGAPLTGYLLDGDGSVVLREVIMRTKMIQISFTARQGISGAWVVREGQLLGVVYAAYPHSPYLHMIPAEAIFKDIESFLQVPSIRVATIADVPPPAEERPASQLPPRRVGVASDLQSGSTLPSASPTAVHRAQKRLVVFCDGSWLGGSTHVAGAPRSNIRMLADMVGYVQPPDLDAGENPAMVHSIIPHQPNVVAGYQKGVGSQQNFLDFAWDGTTAERLRDECVAVYRFIVEHYTDDHQIWLFGHSRGAYTVRSVAGMINNCGIIKQSHRLNSEEVDVLCSEIYRIYRSDLPIDSPSSDEMKRYRGNADYVWQVKQPIQFMGLIDSVGPLGLPRIPGAFDSTSFEFFDNHVSSTVQHVYHAVAVHERLSVIPPCPVEAPDEDFARTVVTQKWFPGTHYDLGRTTFRFIPPYSHNYVGGMLGLTQSLLTRTILPNEVLADCVLKWLLEGVRDVGHPTTQVIPDIDRIIGKFDCDLARPAPNSTGSGDVYGNPLKMQSTNFIANAVLRFSMEWTRLLYLPLTGLLSSPLREENVYFKSLAHIIHVLASVTDRRIPGSAANIYPYQGKRFDGDGVEFSIEVNAMMEDLNEWNLPRYPSKTLKTFELWNEIFGGSAMGGEVSKC